MASSSSGNEHGDEAHAKSKPVEKHKAEKAGNHLRREVDRDSRQGLAERTKKAGKNHDREIASKNQYRDFKDGESTLQGESGLYSGAAELIQQRPTEQVQPKATEPGQQKPSELAHAKPSELAHPKLSELAHQKPIEAENKHAEKAGHFNDLPVGTRADSTNLDRAAEHAKNMARQIAAHSISIPARPSESHPSHELPVVRAALLHRLADSTVKSPLERNGLEPSQADSTAKAKVVANSTAHRSAILDKIAQPELPRPPRPQGGDLQHTGRTAGVQSVKDVGDMAHGFVDGFSQSIVEVAKGSVDYLGKHNLISDLSIGTADSLTTAYNYYADHFKSNDGKDVAKDAVDVNIQIWSGAKQWSDDYSGASHYERGQQAGKLGLLLASGGIGEDELAGAVVVNTSKNIGKLLSASGRIKELGASVASTSRMLRTAESAEKAGQLASDAKRSQAIFSSQPNVENLYSRGGRGDNPMGHPPDGFGAPENTGEGRTWKQARHDAKAIEAIDKMFKPGTEGVSAEHVSRVKETLLSLPAEHMKDLHSKGFTIHAPRTIREVIPGFKPNPDDIAGVTNFDLAKHPRIVVPERAFTDSAESLREVGVNTEGVVRHEVGHGLDHVNGWSMRDDLFESHVNAQRMLRDQYINYRDKIRDSIKSAEVLGEPQKQQELQQHLRKVMQYGEYLHFDGNANVGLREVVADFYAIAHGGTNRYGEVTRKLFKDFGYINETLISENWPKKKLFGMF